MLLPWIIIICHHTIAIITTLSSNCDPAEEAIDRMIEGIQTLLNPVNITPEEEKEKAIIKISEATEKHFELQIRTLQDAPRDPSN